MKALNGFLVLAAAACAASPAAADAAVVALDNKDHASLVTTGSQADFRLQTFRPNVAGPGSGDTVAANSPLPATVYLTSITLVRAPTGNGSATTGNIYLDLYAGTGGTGTGGSATGTYVGSSANAIDVVGAMLGADVTWTFANLPMASADDYTFEFSTDAAAGNSAVGRVSAANFGGGFVSTYAGGSARGPSAAVAFDARFKATYDTVPEPTSLGMAGVAAAGLLARRRRVRVARRS